MERNTGARGLRAIIEKTMTNIMYELPSDEFAEKCIITKDVIIGDSEPEVIRNETSKAKRSTSSNKKMIVADNGIA